MLEFGTWGHRQCRRHGRKAAEILWSLGGSSTIHSSRTFSSPGLEIREGGSGGTGEAGCRCRGEEREAAGNVTLLCQEG
jgi:hypothetical protein